ncbi:MAG: V-type ATP synthase subunit K [Clostridiales bacterium]|nr:V-type ATP synthase subunit K [Clostridiales bacterium]
MTGIIWAALGTSLALILPGIGSSLGVGMAGRAAAGVIAEDPEKSGQCTVLQLLPATQGIYGFIVAFLIASNSGLLSGAGSSELPVSMGMSYFYAALPIAIVGLVSAYMQSRVCCAGMNIVAKQGEGGKGIVLAIMVETYAILAVLVSVLMVVGVK